MTDRDPETGDPIDPLILKMLERRTPYPGGAKVVVISTPGPKSWVELDFEKAVLALARSEARARLKGTILDPDTWYDATVKGSPESPDLSAG